VEQRRIAAILDQADDLRRKRREAMRQTDHLAHVIYQERFGEPVTNPKGLECKVIGELGVHMEYGPRFYNEAYSDTGVRVVRITDLAENGTLDFDSMPKLDVSERELQKHRSRRGELLFARTGATVGKVALVSDSDPVCIPGAYFIRLRFPAEVDPVFAWYSLRTTSIQRIVTERSRQSAQQNFSGPGLRRLPFLLPAIDQQREFARVVAAVCHLTSENNAHLAKLDALFASLQHRAFRGEL
jgi:type I restriction enzyme S subunit